MAPIFEKHKQKPSSGSHFPLTATPFLSQTSADLPSISRLSLSFSLESNGLEFPHHLTPVLL